MSAAADGIRFSVHVRPGGRRDAVEGDHGGALAVRVSAPPTDGRANEAVRAVLAAAFEVRRTDVEIAAGRSSRRKEVVVSGDPVALRARLEQLRGG